MPTVRPRWSIEGTQWPAPQNTERAPRELLSNEEREAMRKTIEDADRAAESALSTTQRLHQRLQGLEDQGFVPAAPEYRANERNQAEVAILSRGDRLSAAQLRNETQKVLDVWSTDDAEHWRVTHVYGKGRASRLRRKKTGERQELAETRRLERPDEEGSFSTKKSRASRGSRDSRSGLTTRQTGTTSVTSGPRIASAAELGVERPPELRALRPAFYRRTLAGDLTLTEEGDEASTAPPSPIKPEVSTITEGRETETRASLSSFQSEASSTTSKWKSRFRMAAKKAAALESVDSDAPPPIDTLALAVAAARKAALKPQRRDLQLLRDASTTLRRFQTSSVIDIEHALLDASQSVDDTRAGTDEALDKADALQDSCAAVRDALLLNEEPPARLPAEDVSDALGMATRLSSNFGPLCDAVLQHIAETQQTMMEGEETASTIETGEVWSKRAEAVSNATNELLDACTSFAKYMRDAELNAPFQASAAVIMLAVRWRRRARRARRARAAGRAGARAAPAEEARAPPPRRRRKKNRAYADAAARWRGSIADIADQRRDEAEELRRTALLAAQQDDSELAALLEEDKEEEAPSVPAPAAPAPLKRERSTRTTTPRYVKKEMSEKELSLKDHIGGVAARRIDALYDRLGDVTAKLPVVLDDMTEDATVVSSSTTATTKVKNQPKRVRLSVLEDLAAVAGINVPGQLRLEELSVRCHEHRASEESVRHGNQKKKLEDIQHLGGTCVPRQIWTSHVLELAEDAYAMDSLLDALEKAATMGSKRRRRRLGLSSNKGESKILLEQRRYWGRHASEGPASPGRLKRRAAARTAKLLSGVDLSLADRNLVAAASKNEPEEDDFWEPEPMPALLRDKYIKRPHPFEG